MRVRRCFFWPVLLVIGLTIAGAWVPSARAAGDTGPDWQSDNGSPAQTSGGNGQHSTESPAERANGSASVPAENPTPAQSQAPATKTEAPAGAATADSADSKAGPAPAEETDVEKTNIRKGDTVPTTSTGTTGEKKTLRPMGSAWQVWLALLVVLGLICLAVFVLRKACPGIRAFGGLPMVQVLGRTYLSPKQVLAMVKVDRQLILLGLTEHNISTLMTITDPDDVARFLANVPTRPTHNVGSVFSNLFNREQQEYTSDEPMSLDSASTGVAEPERSAVSDLRQQLNSLMGKVERLKGMGGPQD